MTAKKPTLEQDVAAWLDLEQKRASIVEQQDAIKARIREAAEVGKHETPAGTVTVSVNRRFDETLARTVVAAYNPAILEQVTLTKAAIDTAALKKLLPPVTYEACMKDVGAPRVSIQ